VVRNSVGRRRIGKKEEQEGEKGGGGGMKNPNSKMRRSERPKKVKKRKNQEGAEKETGISGTCSLNLTSNPQPACIPACVHAWSSVENPLVLRLLNIMEPSRKRRSSSLHLFYSYLQINIISADVFSDNQ